VTAAPRSSASLREELAQLDVDPLALDSRALVVALPSWAMEARVKPAHGMPICRTSTRRDTAAGRMSVAALPKLTPQPTIRGHYPDGRAPAAIGRFASILNSRRGRRS
jgi:hypothetical protein